MNIGSPNIPTKITKDAEKVIMFPKIIIIRTSFITIILMGSIIYEY